MPTYDYRCGNCSHEFEEFQNIKDEPLKKCPKCGKNKLQRLITGGAGIVFKGSGFYETDYKRSKPPKNEPKADTKPAAKTDSPCASCPAACKESPASQKS
ncbi:MAG: zinc ribbon domain-containing protein [Planctomycetaceae bacterium]|jgi:putative FmdB family regulatory protein|nr:zinc ribbon domain-containing protein [Planctomycetaceae bacterium]